MVRWPVNKTMMSAVSFRLSALPWLMTALFAAALAVWPGAVRGAYQPPRFAGEDGAPLVARQPSASEQPIFSPLAGASHERG
ncbi:MAG: hypothetical protein N3A66_02365, partial [Planctomycetota bacterium]|nr:hypothetical protein [Planctomycetota bacterium]